MKLRTSCFGKLRMFSDFIEPAHRTAFDCALRDWLVTSVGQAMRTFEGTWKSRRAYLVAWRLRRRGGVQAAVVWPSGDSVGRWFPFAIYTQVPRRKIRLGALAELPLALAPLWSGLQEIPVTPDGRHWTEIEEGGWSPAAVQYAMKKARLRFERPERPLADFRANLERWLAVDLLEKVLTPAFGVLYPRLAWKLVEIARKIGREDDPLAAIRFPATDGLNTVFQAAFWLHVLERMAPGIEKVPTLFLPAGEAQRAGIWVLFRDPLPLDLPALFGSDTAHRYLVDLRQPEMPPAEEEKRLRLFTSILQERLTDDLDVWQLAELPLEQFRAVVEPAAGPATPDVVSQP